MRLYFLRHAPACSREEWSGADSMRPLSEDGLTTITCVAEAIASLDLRLGAIVTSPFERALRTATIVREHLPDAPPLVLEPMLEPSSFTLAAMKAMLDPYRDAPAVMLVGHEPSMTAVLEALLGGGRYSLKKGGLVRVDLDQADASSAVLRWFVPPRLLKPRG